MNYSITDSINDIVIIEDLRKSKIVYINKMARDVLKINEENSQPTYFKELLGNDDVFENLKHLIAKNIDTQNKVEGKTQLKAMDNSCFEVFFSCEWENYELGTVIYIFKNVSNVYENEMQESDTLFDKLAELANDRLFQLDLNRNTIKFLGKSKGVFADVDFLEDYPKSILDLNIIHEDDIYAHTEMLECFQKAIEKPIELRYRVNETDYEWYKITYKVIKDNSNQPSEILGKLININAEKMLEAQSRIDTLTGLYNKTTTEHEIDRLIRFRKDYTHAIFTIDMDNFNHINDNLGYGFGDTVLYDIAEELKQCFRKNDIIGRIGGDEFIIVMRDIKDTAIIMDRAEVLCKALNKTFTEENVDYSTSASIGIAIYPDDGVTYEELYKKSDTALYEIKRTGKDGFRRFHKDLNDNKDSFLTSELDGRRMKPVLINNTIISSVLRLLYETKDLDVSLRTILEYIGNAFKVDRCYTFETIDGGDTYYNKYKWCKNKEDYNTQITGIEKSNLYNMMKDSNKEGIFYTNNIETIKDKNVYDMVKKSKTKSVFAINSLKNYNESMFLCLEDCQLEREWSEEEIVTLLHIGRLIFTAIDNYNTIEILSKYAVTQKRSCFFNKRDEDYNIVKVGTEELAEAIFDFCNEENDNMSVMNILRDSCELLNIDKVSTILYSDEMQKYMTLYEYNANGSGESFDYSAQFQNEMLDNKEYYKTDLEREGFLKLLNEYNYLYTDNFKEIGEEMHKVGFKSEYEDKIQEMCVFVTNNTNIFGYMAFERYSNEKLTNAEINILATFCSIINERMKKNKKLEEYENDILMKDLILKNEKIPIAVVEKHTYKVLYHNELYYNIFPNIEVGAVCYKLLDRTKVCKNCCFNQDILINDSNKPDHQWIKKSIPFTLNNGTEAYMIYAKDSMDYIKQINAVDNLTQALLRRGFEEYYKNSVRTNTKKYVLCTIDIDKFKYINELFDYRTGDNVLRKLANVIRSFLGDDENFCRMNDEKFAMFLSYQDEIHLNTKIKTLSKKFEEMRDEYFSDAKITVNIGVTVVNRKMNINTLLDQCEIARKSAKGSHKNTFAYYDPEIDSKIKAEVHLEERIPHAIENNEFVPFLQAKFDLNTNKIYGAEALVRWIAEDGMIFPDQFIPLFEKNGFITTLDFIIYEKVMEYIRKCLDNGLPVYVISVNVSRNHISNKNFVNDFMKLVDKYDIPTEYLELEITESVFIEDRNALKKFVKNIKESNLKISIDDFGSAYSSLQNLTEIDVDTLKIDKGFLDNIDMTAENITKDEILIRNIIRLAKELDFHVICEGIETQEQIEMLRRNGCEYGQGYVFARPISLEDYEKEFLL